MSLKEYGQLLEKAPASFELLRDIEEFEGPIISEFDAGDRGRFLLIWRDVDSQYNRWLAVKVSENVIAQYEGQQITLHKLICQASEMFLTDADFQGVFSRWYALTREDLPDAYFPCETALHDPSLRPP